MVLDLVRTATRCSLLALALTCSVCLAQIDTLGLEWETTALECIDFSECGIADEVHTYMWLSGDQLSMYDENQRFMFLIRLSGEYVGFTIIDHGARKATYFPWESVLAAEEAFEAAAVVVTDPPNNLLQMAVDLGLVSCMGCDRTVTVVRGDEAVQVGVTSDLVQWNGAAMATLPTEFAAAMNEQPDEFEDMVHVYAHTHGWALADPTLPGYQELAAFFGSLAEASGDPTNWIRPMMSGLTSGMSRVMASGMPHSTVTTTRMGIELSGPMESMAPMVESMFERLMPPPTVSVQRLVRVIIDPILDDDPIFFDGGMPDGYTVEYGLPGAPI